MGFDLATQADFLRQTMEVMYQGNRSAEYPASAWLWPPEASAGPAIPAVFELLWPDAASKEAALTALSDMLHHSGAIAYMLVLEIWIGAERGLNSLNKGPRPSEDPERREGLVICGATRASPGEPARTIIRLFDILRDATPILVEQTQASEIFTRFTGLFGGPSEGEGSA